MNVDYFDGSRNLGEEDRRLIGLVNGAECAKIAVLNKTDLGMVLTGDEYEEIRGAADYTVEVSAKDESVRCSREAETRCCRLLKELNTARRSMRFAPMPKKPWRLSVKPTDAASMRPSLTKFSEDSAWENNF